VDFLTGNDLTAKLATSLNDNESYAENLAVTLDDFFKNVGLVLIDDFLH